MNVQMIQPAATGTLRPALAARPTPASSDTPEFGDKVEVGSQSGKKLAWSLGGAALGAVGGLVATHFVTPMLTPILALGVGALIAAGPFKIKGKKVSEYLSVFKGKEGDAASEATARRRNLYVRIGAGLVGGVLAAHFIAPALMLTTVGAGVIAGWKLGSREAQ